MALITSTDAGREIERLRELREVAGLTQLELAQRAGCSLAYVRQLEAGAAPRWSRVVPDILAVFAAIKQEVNP